MAHQGKKGQGQSRSKRLTNGEVINFLKTLPEGGSFGHLEESQDDYQDDNQDGREFLRHLYVSLRGLFSATTTSSRANHTRISDIKELKVLPSLQDKFPQFNEDPLKFWKRHDTTLEPYNRHVALHRTKLFLENAAQLDSKFQEQEILRRFVSVGAWKLFQRAIPTSGKRVMKTSLKRFLDHVGISYSERVDSSTKAYEDIIRRGQRCEHFCLELALGKPSDENMEQSSTRVEAAANQANRYEIFGPLFFSSIPGAIFDDKSKLVGDEYKNSIHHLKRMDILEASKKSNATDTTKALLDFHQTFFWVNEEAPSSKKRRPGGEGHETAYRKRSRRSSIVKSIHHITQGAEYSFAKAAGEEIFRSNITTFDPIPKRQGLETRALCEGQTASPATRQQGEQEVGFIHGAEAQSRPEMLHLAAYSGSSMECVLPESAQSQITHFDATALDVVTLSHITCPEFFDATTLDFVGPFLEAAELDFVDPEPPVFVNPFS